MNPDWAIVKIMDYIRATLQIAQTTLRSGVGQVDLDTLLARREQLNERLQKSIDEQTEPWGVKVTIVEIKDVELPQTMQRAMAKQAEAEREKRAKIIHAAGEAALQIPEPPIARFLFADTRRTPLWAIIQLYFGYEWLTTGWGKLINPAGA